MHFKIDWASLIVGRKFTIFCYVLLCISGQFSKYKPPWGLYLEGRFNGGFFALPARGLIFGGVYTWRDLFFGILRYLNKKGRLKTSI